MYLLHWPYLACFVRLSGNFILGDSYFGKFCAYSVVFGFYTVCGLLLLFISNRRNLAMDKNWQSQFGAKAGNNPTRKSSNLVSLK